MSRKFRINASLVLPALLFVTLAATAMLTTGCASSHYMLDDPVNDPIMTCDDQQDADLAKVEDGEMTGSAGECPT